jgi:hypothetical protein
MTEQENMFFIAKLIQSGLLVTGVSQCKIKNDQREVAHHRGWLWDAEIQQTGQAHGLNRIHYE